ncbi:hypothetical protein [Caminibacter sp.]
MKSRKFKDLVDILQKNGIICKKLDRVELNTKKKINAFLGVNLKSEYCLIIEFLKKSRFLRKDIETLKTIESAFPINFRYKKKILILHSPICSKAKEEIKEWRVIEVKNEK